MSTIQLQLYNASIRRLCQSIVLKSHASAICMNQKIKDFSGITGHTVIDEFPETWKYYLNLSGQYHPTDLPMTVISLDTLETISFDYQTLLYHRATVRAYSLGSTYYEELVARYPDQELLIRGILNPIDLQTAITAPEFKIIGWDASEVESGEYSLIERLQAMIDSHNTQWYVRDYQSTHDLYIHTYLAGMYSLLPSWIRSIRKELCKTPEAHSFHIWNYLDSKGYLSEYKDFLTKEQALWLYRNISWVYANTGKKETFTQLLDVVLTKRSIPLGSYSLALNNENILDSLAPTPKLQRTPLNMLTLTAADIVTREIDFILEKELPLAKDNVAVFDRSLVRAKRALTYSVIPDLPTKIYESAMVDSTAQEPYILADVLLNEWVHLASTNRYLANITISDPATGNLMSMNMREALITLIYVYNKLAGVEILTVPDLMAYQVRRIPLPTFDDLRKLAQHHRVSNTEILQLLNDQVDLGTIISTEGFYDTCYELHQALLRHRMLYVIRHHMEERIQMELVVSRIYEDRRCQINTTPNQTYSEFFNNRGWLIPELAKADLELLEVALVTKATGADSRSVKSLKEIQGALLRLMSQLGPYSSQYLQTINNTPVVMTDTVGIRLGDLDMSIGQAWWLDTHTTITQVTSKLKQRMQFNMGSAIEFSTGMSLDLSVDLDTTVTVTLPTAMTYIFELLIADTNSPILDDLIENSLASLGSN